MRPNRKTINVTDLRLATREIMENAHCRGQHYVVERAGQPMVAILSVDEYERLLASLGEPRAAPAGAADGRESGTLAGQ